MNLAINHWSEYGKASVERAGPREDVKETNKKSLNSKTKFAGKQRKPEIAGASQSCTDHLTPA